jgi:hypothetical protein
VENRGELAILIQTSKNHEPEIVGYRSCGTKTENLKSERKVFAGKKYKPVDQKVRPIRGTLPEEFRIIRDIKGDPLANMPKLEPNPPDFVPTGRYTQERKDHMDRVHDCEFLWPEEMKAVHHLLMLQNEAFAWTDSERGTFREDFFPPIKFPVVPHKPWVLKNIPIPPGIKDEVCRILKSKMEAGVYESSNSSYRSRWFCVIKKDGKSLRLVHSLEPLNEVTIAHSGVPPATDELAEGFAGRSCGGMFDLYVGYDEQKLHPDSRDLTTFQTPFGAKRLVTLPMGWTNAVPIFHDDVAHILKEETPHITDPYIDDVGVKGPKTRYELPDGTYETIPENPGICCFVWEHLQNVNRVLQRVRYCGGTFSGLKSVVCAPEIVVVGHRCTYEGRKPEKDKFKAVMNWGPCKDVSDIRAFLGTVGTCRVFIKDFAKMSRPLNDLLKSNVPFEWGPAQEKSMQDLKDALISCPALRPLDYTSDVPVILGVDTSWKAVGFWICQEDPDNKKKRYFARFGSITLNDREARYSQPKRELFGLFRALEASKYWLLGCRNLIIETDAKYIKGMLSNPGVGPNAAIMRWIDYILMYHFTLRHIPGKTFAADGLSRRDRQPGDDEYLPDNDWVDEPEGPLKFEYPNLENNVPDAEADLPLEFEDFKDEIDTRGGYQITVAQVWSFMNSVNEDLLQTKDEVNFVEPIDTSMNWERFGVGDAPKETVRCISSAMLPDITLKLDDETREAYEEQRRTETAKSQDDQLGKIKRWLVDPHSRPPDLNPQQYAKFARNAKQFYLDENNKLFRRAPDGKLKAVIEKTHRMYIMRSLHDHLGHKGSFATKEFVSERFWWPEMEQDIHWYVKSCHVCQLRQKTLVRIPPTVTHTPGLFQVIHVDVMHMTPASNGCKYIVHGRCALSSWMEGRPLRNENARAIGQWLFEDIICRWGCIVRIVTDNGGPFKRALAWLEDKYGIKGIQISAYNSRANGKIERPHWDVRQALWKACSGDVQKWYWYFTLVMWADRITVRKRLGCSPYFITTGSHPTLPLDIVEATWLVDLPNGKLSTADLIGYRAKALAKHKDHIEQIRRKVSKQKLDDLLRYEREHRYKIKAFDFKPGALVLVRNTAVESSLDKKMKPRYLGPMVVVTRNKGGAYIVAELDGSVWHEKIGAFRLVPYFARHEIDLPEGVENFVDIAKRTLDELKESNETGTSQPDIWFENAKHVPLDVNDTNGNDLDLDKEGSA